MLDKISFRPGSLAAPMGKQLEATGETPSEYLRRLVAADCGVEPPAMRGYEATISAVNERRKERAIDDGT